MKKLFVIASVSLLLAFPTLGGTESTQLPSNAVSGSNIDIDGNEQFDALTDGLLVLRSMFGLPGTSLISGAVASDATYTDAEDIESRITGLGNRLDIDDNGNIDALTDGLIVLRYLFGLTGDTLVKGVVAADANRFSASEIEAHMAILTSLDIESPVITSSANYTAAENQTAVGKVAATDVDTDDSSITFTVSGSELSITSAGVLTFASAPDYETKSTYTAVITATDGTNLTPQDIIVSVSDIDETPIMGALNYTADENQTSIGSVVATDPEGEAVSFSVSGSELLITSDGVLSFALAPDYETKTSYMATVTASDGTNSITQSVTVTVTDVDDDDVAPFFTSGPIFNAEENQTAIGTVTAMDADDDVVTFTIVGSELAITSAGVLTFVSAPDYETKSSYTATVKATDGVNSATQNITVSVTDVNEQPTFELGKVFEVSENNTFVGLVGAQDPDGDDLIYSTNTPGLTISNSGEIIFTTAPDFEANSRYSLQVTVSDDLLQFSGEVIILVSDLEDHKLRGSAIYGSSTNRIGNGVSISKNGNIIGIPLPTLQGDAFESIKGQSKIFNWDGRQYIEKSSFEGSRQCCSIAINADGTKVVYGDPGWENRRGRVYLGNDQYTHYYGYANLQTYFGGNIAIDGEGDDVIVSAPNYDVDLGSRKYLKAGYVRRFTYDFQNNSWGWSANPGRDLYGLANNAYVGNSLDLSHDGDVILTSENKSGIVQRFNGVTLDAGRVSVNVVADDCCRGVNWQSEYTFDGIRGRLSGSGRYVAVVTVVDEIKVYDLTTQNQVGGTLIGTDVDISDDGSILSVLDGEYIKIYVSNENKWKQRGESIAILTPSTLRLSGDGRILIVKEGYYERDANENTTIAGRVRTFSLETNDKNGSPVFTSESVFIVPENDVNIGTVVALDPEGNSVSYSLSGVDASQISINHATGLMAFNSPPNYEVKSSYSVIVGANDGFYEAYQQIIISISNLNEAPIFSPTNFTVLEREVNIGTVIAIDPDGGSVSYSLTTGGDSDKVSVDSASGVMSFQEPSDYERQSLYSFTVQASDGVNTSSQIVTVNIEDIRGPMFTSEISFYADENQLIVGSVQTVDSDGGGDISVTYALTGFDAALFTIDPLSGAITFKNNPDFEVQSIYRLTVSASDGVNIATQDIHVYLRDIKSPSLLGMISYGNAPGVAALSGDGLTIAIVSASTVEGTNINMYSLSDAGGSFSAANLVQVLQFGHLINIDIDLNYLGDVMTLSSQQCVVPFRKINGVWSNPSAPIGRGYMFDCFGGDRQEVPNRGFGVSVSRDGNRFAYGLDSGTGAKVLVAEYDLDADAWVNWVHRFSARTADPFWGDVVSMSDDGTRIAVGGAVTDGVRIFQYENDGWQEIQGVGREPFGNFDETSVALSGDGTVIAVTRQNEDSNNMPSYYGIVQVFQYIGSSWTQLGQDIIGQSAEEAGMSLALSNDGQRIIIGGPGYDPSPSNTDDGSRFGRARIFDYKAGRWIQKNDDIVGLKSERRAGHFVDLSSDGAIAIVVGDSLQTSGPSIGVYKID